MNDKINSALALTMTQVIQDCHVFAYIIANDISSCSEENPIYGSIIILASFSDKIGESGELITSKDQAVRYATDLIKLTGYNQIFWTTSHRWFNLKRRPFVDEVIHVDDKSAIENAADFINFSLLANKKRENELFDKSIEEERRSNRLRCNPDHVEHFIHNLERLRGISADIQQYENNLDRLKNDLLECVNKLKFHYSNHPSHEDDALRVLSERLTNADYLPVVYTYTQYKEMIASKEEREKRKIYDKNTKSSSKSGTSEKSEKSEASNKSEKDSDKTYVEIASNIEKKPLRRYRKR